LQSFIIGGETVGVSEGDKDSTPRIRAVITIPDIFDATQATLLTQKILATLRKHNLAGDCKTATDLTTMTIQDPPRIRPLHPKSGLISIGGMNAITLDRLNEALASLQSEYETPDAWNTELKKIAGEQETVGTLVSISWEGDQPAATQVINALDDRLHTAGYAVRNAREENSVTYRPNNKLDNSGKSVTMDAITAQLYALKHDYPTAIDADSIQPNSQATRQLPNDEKQRG
jgi:hypothetical protein